MLRLNSDDVGQWYKVSILRPYMNRALLLEGGGEEGALCIEIGCYVDISLELRNKNLSSFLFSIFFLISLPTQS